MSGQKITAASCRTLTPNKKADTMDVTEALLAELLRFHVRKQEPSYITKVSCDCGFEGVNKLAYARHVASLIVALPDRVQETPQPEKEG